LSRATCSSNLAITRFAMSALPSAAMVEGLPSNMKVSSAIDSLDMRRCTSDEQ
jgi:hypothetical protein